MPAKKNPQPASPSPQPTSVPDQVAVLVSFHDLARTAIADMVAAQKTFSTGSRGYYTNGKIIINGKTYQVQVQMVEIGSKPAQPSK